MKTGVICFGFLLFTLIFSCNNAEQQGASISANPYLGQEPPGFGPEVFAPGIISCDDTREMGCTWMPDLREFYFTRQGTPESAETWSIWYTREIDGKWSDPQIVDFSGVYLDAAPFITYDGKYMLFYRGSRTDTTVHTGTWITERDGDSWTEPRFFADAYVMNTVNHKTFYCTMDATEGKANRQIGYMTYSDGEFSEKKPIQGDLNTANFEAHGIISPGNDYILFDSDRPGGIDEIDIYVSFRDENGNWSEGINLGKEINQGHYTIPSISPDGKYLFINAEGDVYWVGADIIEQLKQ